MVRNKSIATKILDGWQVGRRWGSELWHIHSWTQDAALVAKAHRKKLEVGLRTQLAAAKEVLTSEYKLCCLAFPESHVEQHWDEVEISDKSTFSSADGEPLLAYRPQTMLRVLQLSVNVDLHKQLSCVCLLLVLDAWWRGWTTLSYRRAPRCLQHKQILKIIMMPFVKPLYPNAVTQFQDHTSIRDSHHWSWVLDVNHTENMLNEVN